MALLSKLKRRIKGILGKDQLPGEVKLPEPYTYIPVMRGLSELAGKDKAEPAVMFLLHASPFRSGCGGTEIHVLDLVSHLKLPRAVLVYPSSPTHVTAAEVVNGNVDAPEYFAFRLSTPLSWYSEHHSAAENLIEVIAHHFCIGAVMIEHLYMWPQRLPEILTRNGIPYICVIHDFFSVCPSLNLVNANTLRPCSIHYGGADESQQCLQTYFNSKQTTPPCAESALLKEHQARFAEIFSKAVAVVFPSRSSCKRVLANLPLNEKKAHVIPHGYPQPKDLEPVAPASPKVLRVSLAGVLAAPIKGSDLIVELLGATKSLPIEWHFFGVVDANNFRQRIEDTGARIVIHGPYERATIIHKMRAAGIDVALFMSIAEETFSFTLSEAWCAGIPAVAPRWGAFEERIEQSGLGWLVAPHSVSAVAEKLRELASEREKLQPIREKLKSFRHTTLEENAAAYRALIEPIRTRKIRPIAVPGNIEEFKSETDALRQSFERSDKKIFALDIKAVTSLKPLSDVSLSKTSDGIRIDSSGNDPAIVLPKFKFGSGRRVLRLEISAPSEDMLQLFYSTKTEPGWPENCSLRAVLYKGRNEVYLPLDAEELKGPLRLDPGTAPGMFVLHALEIR